METYLETHPLETLYDDVFIPALTAAKRDRELGTLTDEDVQFIIQATRAIVQDLGLRPAVPMDVRFAPTTTSPATELSTITPPPEVLGCPAHDAADELGLLMLQQLLDPERYRMAIISPEMLTGEVLCMIERQHIGLICMAAPPPGAMAPVRYLCKRLRARFPGCRIVVGRWGPEEAINNLRMRFHELSADEVGTTLLETRNQISQLSQLVSPSTPSSMPPSG